MSTSLRTYRAVGHAARALVGCTHRHRTLLSALRCAARSPYYDTILDDLGRGWAVEEDDSTGLPVARRIDDEEFLADAREEVRL